MPELQGSASVSSSVRKGRSSSYRLWTVSAGVLIWLVGVDATAFRQARQNDDGWSSWNDDVSQTQRSLCEEWLAGKTRSEHTRPCGRAPGDDFMTFWLWSPSDWRSFGSRSLPKDDSKPLTDGWISWHDARWGGFGSRADSSPTDWSGAAVKPRDKTPEDGKTNPGHKLQFGCELLPRRGSTAECMAVVREYVTTVVPC